MADSFKGIHESAGRPQELEDIRALADAIVDGPDQEAVLRLALELTIGYGDWGEQIMARWNSMGRPRVREFAPYLTHVLTVDLFFYLGMAASQIGSDRKSNKADIAYLYYLPFCMVFTSRDNLQVRSAPLFFAQIKASSVAPILAKEAPEDARPAPDRSAAFGRKDSAHRRLRHQGRSWQGRSLMVRERSDNRC